MVDFVDLFVGAASLLGGCWCRDVGRLARWQALCKQQHLFSIHFKNTIL
jgi:hypothetical protein